ncbi:pentapeptide repeat-containing protein [Streptosporangium pseudovulgare]|uniref:pentapeptide repeat-containing protein n=1 Tax=Streptosporangium pseudovulgare TaxID=35765 RepID=UPI0016711AEF|nr:pentapeptide repeat-containing protein [Streptosporangium pseudovulgare]
MRTPRPAAWWIVPVTLLVGGAVGGVAWLLLGAGWSVAEATARQGAIQTALAAGAGVGAAVTLMLAFRRQRHQEHAAHVTAYLAERNAALAEQVADNTKHDATERRVTDLYTKAAEQLGHDKAAVRLAGLYALERLAQDNPGHRQTIVNVICAYLRMPYTPPEPAPAPDPERDHKAALRAARRRHQAARAGVALPAEPAPRQEDGDREGELQVRLTAQRILAAHLRDDRPADRRSTLPAAPAFWEGMSLDLTGATLIDFDLTGGHATEAVFDKATFAGDVRFVGAIFAGDVRFNGATFTGDAWFNGATFTGDATCDKATFARHAMFVGASFAGRAMFVGATFTGVAWFDKVPFIGVAGFDKASFAGDARFLGATFFGRASFLGASFAGRAMFAEATFAGGGGFAKASFAGDAWFAEATFIGRAQLDGAVVVDPAADHVWPDGWRLEATSEGTGRLIREETGGDPAPDA